MYLNASEKALLYNNTCIEDTNIIRVYGQTHATHQLKVLEDIARIQISPNDIDFYIDIYDTTVSTIPLYFYNNKITLPVNSIKTLDSPGDITITTMVKDEEPRLKEWIDYHLSLGVSTIVIFCNNCTDRTYNMLVNLCNPSVIPILFNYTTIIDSRKWNGWNNVQRIQLCVGTQLLKRSKWICYLDVDEFIYTYGTNIQDLMLPYYHETPAITIPSIVLTCKGIYNDQNILDTHVYSNMKPMYTKTLVNTKYISDFICNPHDFPGSVKVPKGIMYHGHFPHPSKSHAPKLQRAAKYKKHYTHVKHFARWKNV